MAGESNIAQVQPVEKHVDGGRQPAPTFDGGQILSGATLGDMQNARNPLEMPQGPGDTFSPSQIRDHMVQTFGDQLNATQRENFSNFIDHAMNGNGSELAKLADPQYRQEAQAFSQMMRSLGYDVHGQGGGNRQHNMNEMVMMDPRTGEGLTIQHDKYVGQPARTSIVADGPIPRGASATDGLVVQGRLDALATRLKTALDRE